MPENIQEVRLPAVLCQQVESKYGARFGGLEPFLAFVMQQLVNEKSAEMDQAEQRILEERLRDLGYI